MSIRDKIKEVSLPMFLEYGIENTSIRNIYGAAGISNGSLFHQFSSKNDIVIELYTDFKKEALKNTYDKIKDIKTPREFFYTNLKINVEWRVNNPDKARFINMVSKTPLIEGCIDYQDKIQISHIYDFMRESLRKGEVIGYNLESLMYITSYFIDSTADFLRKNEVESVDNYIDFVFKQYWRAIVNF